MNRKLLVISGVGYTGNNSLTGDNIKNKKVKINMGLATAIEAAENGYDLFLISKTEEKLNKISTFLKNNYPSVTIQYKAINATKKKDVFSIVKNIKKMNFDELSYVHSLGLSAGAYKVENDNPYQDIEHLTGNLILQEYESVVNSLLYFIQAFMPLLDKQKESNICIINSMSAIRAYPYGYSHSAAKGGLHNAVRSLCLELHKKNIFISEVLPGLVDTGYYDKEDVKISIKKIVKYFGYDWTKKEELPMMQPQDVAKAVLLCLTSGGHILSLNMVSKGQIPHMGS